MDVKCQS